MKYCNKCAAKTERKEFDTFSYDWCPRCKIEVEKFDDSSTLFPKEAIDYIKKKESEQFGPIALPKLKPFTTPDLWQHVYIPDKLRGLAPGVRDVYQKMKFLENSQSNKTSFDEFFLEAMRLR